MQVRRRATGLVLGAVLATGLSACAGDPIKPAPYTPSTVTPSAPTASTATSPTQAPQLPPPLPDPSKLQNAAGAEAFAEYYWQMVNYAQSSADLAPLRTLGTATCKPCRNLIRLLQQVFDDGGAIKGGDYTATALSAKPGHDGDHPAYTVTLMLTAESGTVEYPRTTRDRPAAKSRIQMSFVWSRGAWYVELWAAE